MKIRNVVAAASVAFGLAVTAQAASAAAVTYDVDFTGTDNLGAVTANMILTVNNGTVVSGTGTITTQVSGGQGWGTASLAFLSSPTLTTVYEFNGGTDLWGSDNVYPIDGNGLVFNVGTAAQSGQYQSGGGFAIWSTGGNTYQAGLFDYVNGGHEYEWPVNGTATITEVATTVSAVPLPAALPMFGAALFGVGFWSRRRARLTHAA
jgi:hypothetical protein